MLGTKALRHVMLDHNCSAKQLATVCGISTSALYRRFSGEVFFTLGEMWKCCAYLGISQARCLQIFFAPDSETAR